MLLPNRPASPYAMCEGEFMHVRVGGGERHALCDKERNEVDTCMCVGIGIDCVKGREMHIA